jgi:preprotein translocase subunit SecY
MAVIASFINIFRVPELRKKVLFTLGILVVFRFGVHVSLPGVNLEVLGQLFGGAGGGAGGRLFGLANAFAGGALRQFSVFALGVMPYITASIIFQILTTVIPALERLAKEGRAGQRKIHQYQRYATVGLCFIQASTVVQVLKRFPPGMPAIGGEAGFGYVLMAGVILTAGTLFLMWLGELIDEYGIGNGISMIIMVGIISTMPQAFVALFSSFSFAPTGAGDEMDPGKLLLVLALFFGVVAAVVVITQGQRRIPFQHASQVRGIRRTQGMRSYLPLRVTHAGVIPIIFASALLQIPSFIAAAINNSFLTNRVFNQYSFIYNLLYMLLIIFFCYFYTAITFNPVNFADEMKQHGSFIPGIRPGRRTAQYLERIMTRIALAGAVFLAVIAILPLLVMGGMGLSAVIAGLYGGTSILIVVGVALDVVQRIESHLVMRSYDGFLQKGRIRGRR